MFSFSLRATKETAPYRILANTFGNHNELCLSGGHAFKDKKGLWQFPMLIKDPNVQQYGIGEPVTYYHIECPNYFTDNLIAEGLVVESFRNGQGSHRHVYTWNKNVDGFVRKQEALVVPMGNECADIDIQKTHYVFEPELNHIMQQIKDTRVIPIPVMNNNINKLCEAELDVIHQIKGTRIVPVPNSEWIPNTNTQLIRPTEEFITHDLEDTRVLRVPASDKFHNNIQININDDIEPELPFIAPTLEDTRVVPIPAGKLQPNIEVGSRLVTRIKKKGKEKEKEKEKESEKKKKKKVKDTGTFFKF